MFSSFFGLSEISEVPGARFRRFSIFQKFRMSLFAAWSIVCCSAAVMVALRVLVVHLNVAQLPTRVVAVAMMLGSATVVLLLFVAVAIVSVPVRTPFGFVVFAAVAYSAFRAQNVL